MAIIMRSTTKLFPTLALAAACTTACGGSNVTGRPGGGNGAIALTLSATIAVAPQDGTPAVINATVARSVGDMKAVSLSVTGLPSGAQASFASLEPEPAAASLHCG